MAKLPQVDSKKLIRSLLRAGFEYAPVRGKGSHTALVRRDDAGRPHLVIVPKRSPIPRETLLSIIKQSSLPRDESLELL
jgi:predicted RNA binding protein YcfA (HicA-like mRNA interferase family)